MLVLSRKLGEKIFIGDAKGPAELAIEQAAQKLVVTAETDRLLVQDFAERLTGEKKGQN